jgi:hypothetical protein
MNKSLVLAAVIAAAALSACGKKEEAPAPVVAPAPAAAPAPAVAEAIKDAGAAGAAAAASAATGAASDVQPAPQTLLLLLLPSNSLYRRSKKATARWPFCLCGFWEVSPDEIYLMSSAMTLTIR